MTSTTSHRLLQVTEFTTIDQDLEAEYWTVYIDGSSTVGVRGVGVIFLSFERDILKYGVQL